MASPEKCKCECIYKNCCPSCNYKDPRLIPPLEYDYWNTTVWNNWNTTDGWGPFPSSGSGQYNNTYDNLSGYGLRGGPGSGTLPNGKKLVRVYKYNNRYYDKPSDLVFYNKVWIPVADIPGVEKKFIIKSV